MRVLSDVAADLRFTIRMLRQNPGFSLVAILSLALGIGASSAMFTETQMFFAELIREDRRILDILDADFTYVNGPLARLYGMPCSSSPFSTAQPRPWAASISAFPSQVHSPRPAPKRVCGARE